MGLIRRLCEVVLSSQRNTSPYRTLQAHTPAVQSLLLGLGPQTLAHIFPFVEIKRLVCFLSLVCWIRVYRQRGKEPVGEPWALTLRSPTWAH